MDQLISKQNCCGCGACYNICPNGAIEMRQAIDGFFYPEIDRVKCTDCNLCLNVCPLLNYTNSNCQEPKFYSAANSDSKIREVSSSGGIFTSLANIIFENNGIVFGAKFDDDLHLVHTYTDNEDELIQFRGSKYLQSDVGRSFQLVKHFLKQGQTVLYCGTPCQIAGLQSYLGKSYDNLLTVDLVCHGVPSPGLFNDYLCQSCTKKNINKSDIYIINFRGKGSKYSPTEMYYYYYYSRDNRCLYKSNFWNESFGKAFGANIILRDSCYNCKFSTFPRIADISIGDFWGIDKFDKKLNDNKGISIISINNDKGQYYFDKIKSKLISCKQVDAISATKYNPNFYIPSNKPETREDFFANYNANNDFDNFVNLYLGNNVKSKCDVGILCFTYDNRNYGANMVPFAMCNIIKRLGYSAKVINFYPYLSPRGINKYALLAAIKFRESFIDLTPKIKNAALLKDLNEQFDTFVVGSDQVWNLYNTKDYALSYFLDFVEPQKNIIAYAASFGSDDFKATKCKINKIKSLLKRFDAISLREDSGVELIHKVFLENINCTSVLDPTLLVDRNEYERIISSENCEKINQNYIAYYMLSNDNKRTKALNKLNLQKISQFLNTPLINLRGEEVKFLGKNIFKYTSYPQWLNRIKHASFVITDSFHGVCFSIIFKKNFVYINNVGGITRVENILSKLGINGRICKSFDVTYVSQLFNEKINYDAVYENLDILRQHSLDFLISALDKSKNQEFLSYKILLANKERKNEGLLKKIDKKFDDLKNNLYYYKRLIKWGIYLYFDSLDLKIFKR